MNNADIAALLKIGDAIDDMKAQNTELRAANAELIAEMQRFCDRRDNGEIRSIKTYARFKNLIAKNNRNN